MSQQQQQQQKDKVRIPQDCPALQAVRAAKGVADCNRRYASLLTAAFEVSDIWCDLAQDEHLDMSQFANFTTKMRLLREDLRFAQEDLLIEWTTRTADAAHSTLVSVHQMQCAHRQHATEPNGVTCSAVPPLVIEASGDADDQPGAVEQVEPLADASQGTIRTASGARS